MTKNISHTFKLHIFTITTSLLWFSLYAYVAELSTYASFLGANYRTVGLITGSYGLTQLILRIPLGLISDILRKRKIFIIVGLLISLISSLITFAYPSQLSLLVTRSLAGVTASTWVIYTVMFSSYFKENEATKAVGIMNSYNAIGQLIAMIMGGMVSYYLGTRYLFLLAALGAFLGIFSSLFIYEASIKKKHIHFIDFIKVAKSKQLLVVSILAILSQFITFATAFGFVPLLAKKIGAQNIELSILTMLAIIPAIFISRLAGSYFVPKIGKRNTINLGFIISALLCIIMPWIKTLTLLYIVQFISGIGRSLVFPLLMGLCIEDIEEDKRATAMGFFQSIYGLGMVLGPLVLGSIAEIYGLTIGFAITGLIGFTSVFITQRYVH
jgi:MFS family permease